MSTTKVFTNQTTNGDSTIIDIPERATSGADERIAVMVSGDLDGGNVVPKVSPDGGTTWFQPLIGTVPISITNVGLVFQFDAAGGKLKLELAGAGASTDIDAWVEYRNE